MKKLILIISVLLMVTLITSCENANQLDKLDNQDNAEYDTSVFNVPMRKALEASQDFVKQSVKASASRAAFVELEADDKWEGYIYNDWGGNWNVPSNIYGTSLTTADNTLVINGEELGTLQELVFHKEKINGQDCFTKAVFEYKGYLYYVLDTNNGNSGGYIVLCTEDDLNTVCFTQDGKIGTDDFSNFKIWTWVKGANGKLYRDGNLGYAYTLRNFQMRDGSYATVTVSGFNYYNYGMRVWIKETDGKTVKKNYPYDDDAIYEPEYEPAVDMSKYYADPESSADFIFEITNKTEKTMTVANFIKDARINDSRINIVTKTEDFDLAPGATKVFKYSADLILEDFDNNYVFCNFCYEKGSNSDNYAWYYYISDYIKGVRVVVAQTDNKNNGGEMHTYLPIEFVSKNTFTVKEHTSRISNERVNDYIIANYPKNADGEYYCYLYYISDFKEGYEFYYNRDVFYKVSENEIGNMYSSPCKEKIEEMLNAGQFKATVFDYANILLLDSYPQ